MKIWKLTLRRSSGVNNTLRQSLSLQSFSSENLWENGTLILKPGDRQRGRSTNNIDILTLDVCLPPRIFISFAMISNNKLFQNSTRISGLSSPISTSNFSSGANGGWYNWQNEFWQNLQLTARMKWSVSARMKWSPHAGSHFLQTLHGIATLDHQLVDLHA